MLLDPNPRSRTGIVAISSVVPSHDGTLVACALSEAGSDWWTWVVIDTATGAELPDRVAWAKFAEAAWTADGAGFFYGRFPEPPADLGGDAPNRDMQIRYHRLGTDADADAIVFATPNEPDWLFEVEVSDDGELLVVTVNRGTDPEVRIFIADLPGVRGPDGSTGTVTVRPLIPEATAGWTLLGRTRRGLAFRTDLDAPMGRIVEVDAADGSIIRTLVPEGADAIEFAVLAGGRVATVTLHDASHRIALTAVDDPGDVVTVPLDGMVTVIEFDGRPEDPQLYARIQGFETPGDILVIDAATGAVRRSPRSNLAWDPDDFTVDQAFLSSDDGTRIPLFLARRRDVEPTGDVPTLLYGYGGFQIAIGPTFHPEWLAWMERGGLLAVASLRGGAEYGRAWHDAGRRQHKQNVFDDFAAALRWLDASGWTRRERIGILGRSNGGLLVGATLTQHPELMGAAVAEVGVMDMLRFHRFTIGHGWTSDYGSSDDPEEFRTLLAYSPLHNCLPDAYPATLVTAADHDDRVVPGHSLKFAATLQAAQRGSAPILLRVDTDAGHGAGKPIGKLLDERADVLAFLELAIGRA